MTWKTMKKDFSEVAAVLLSAETFKQLFPIGIIFTMSMMDMEAYLFPIRVGYLISQCLIIGLWTFILLKSGANEESGTLDLGEYTKNEVKYGKKTKGSHKIMTVSEYDQSQCWPKFRGAFLNLLVIVGVHLQWGHTIPLVVSSVMTWIEIPTLQLVKLYVLGCTTSDDVELERPWKQESMFPKFQEALEKARQEKEDKKAGKRQPAGCSTSEPAASVSTEELERREKKRAKRLTKGKSD